MKKKICAWNLIYIRYFWQEHGELEPHYHILKSKYYDLFEFDKRVSIKFALTTCNQIVSGKKESNIWHRERKKKENN